MYATAPVAFNHRGQTLKFAQKVETPPMETLLKMQTLLKCTQPALAIAPDHLIELVDRVIERHPNKCVIPPVASAGYDPRRYER